MRHATIGATALTLALAATVAHAGGGAATSPYTVSKVSGRYATPPNTATQLSLSSTSSSVVSLPFTFGYFGTEYTNLRVFAGGYVVFGTTPPTQGAKTCSPYNTPLDPSQGGSVSCWMEGSGSSRVFKIAWEQLVGTSGLGVASFQLHLYESNDAVVFAYRPRGTPDTWSSFGGFASSLSVRMDATSASDNRYVIPDPALIVGHPGTDFEMVPTRTTFGGRFLYDELVTTEYGIGDAVRRGVPLAGLQAGLFDGRGDLIKSDVIAGDGSFSLTAVALDGGATGSLGIVVENDAARVVRSAGGETGTVTGLRNVTFSGDQDIGTLTIGEREDGAGTLRAILHTALTVQRARDWAASRTSDAIPLLDVVIDEGSGALTRYVPEADESTPAYMVVAGEAGDAESSASAPSSTGSHAPDTWDSDVITRTYGRHVLAAIAASPTTEADDAFDTVSDDENAFAVAFGHYLAAVVDDRDEFIDGIDDASAAVIDLEAPDLTSAAGSDVAGRVAEGLYDLVDAANESHDWIDGRGVEDRAFLVIDSMSSPVTVAGFLEAWAQAGYDASALSRIFVESRALVDDEDERNDTMSESVAVGAVGVCVRDHVLNAYNEDWFAIELPEATDALQVTFHTKALGGPASLTLTLLDARLAKIDEVSEFVSRGDLVQLSVGPLAAGAYHVRVRHDSGSAITQYSLQAHTPFSAAVPDLPDWTVGRPYEQPFTLGGGVAPYGARVPQSGTLPQGLALDGANQRVHGVPTETGTYVFSVEVTDAGDPANREVTPQTVVIHPALWFELGSFVGFPLGRAHDLRPDRVGGTAPYSFVVADGGLPEGISLLPGELRFTGTAAAPGSVDFRVDGVDVAGSARSGSARAVVAMPVEGKKSPAQLLEGDQATGWFLDAVAGSTLRFKVKTSKKQAKRMLFEPVVLGPDGDEVAGGTRKSGKGKASLMKLQLPASGRYFVITGSADGESTELEGTSGVAAPRRLKGTLEEIEIGEPVEIRFGALPGADLQLTAKVARKAEIELRVLALIDPDGNQVSLDGKVRTKGTKLVLDTDLPVGGTWTAVLQATSGYPADVAWNVKLRQPKNASFSAD